MPEAGADFESSRSAAATLKGRDCGIDVGVRMLWMREPRGRSWEMDCLEAALREARTRAAAMRGVAAFIASNFCEDGPGVVFELGECSRCG